MAFKYSEDAEQVAVHPVVRVHPETDRKGLYVNRSFTKHFEGMTAEESAPLLNFLYGHMARPEFTCRVAWRAGTLTFWDNRCTHHNAINDYQGQRRLMHRVTVLDDKPVQTFVTETAAERNFIAIETESAAGHHSCRAFACRRIIIGEIWGA
jgi:taurine dioxygenase